MKNDMNISNVYGTQTVIRVVVRRTIFNSLCARDKVFECVTCLLIYFTFRTTNNTLLFTCIVKKDLSAKPFYCLFSFFTYIKVLINEILVDLYLPKFYF